MTGAPLRKCPTCLTPVSDAQLGLRDFSWLKGTLPGRVAPMDFDFVLEHRGRFLNLEFKPAGAGPLGTGQRLTYRTLVRAGWDVFVVKGEGPVQVGRLDEAGGVATWVWMELDELREMVLDWWEGRL